MTNHDSESQDVGGQITPLTPIAENDARCTGTGCPGCEAARRHYKATGCLVPTCPGGHGRVTPPVVTEPGDEPMSAEPGDEPMSAEHNAEKRLAEQLRGLADDPHARAVLAKAFREAGLANAATALCALADGLDAGTVLTPRVTPPAKGNA